ncbi:hypothetical protein ACEW7V_02015 [Areca yellow leaf disease phytoplasma]
MSLKTKTEWELTSEKVYSKYSIIKEKDNIVETLIQKTKGKEVLLATKS